MSFLLLSATSDRPSVMVSQLNMAPEVDLALEGLAAFDAGERFVARVLATVGDEVRRLAERFAADGTFVGLLACPLSESVGMG